MPSGAGQLGLPRLPGFREMALRRMAAGRRRMVGELTAHRQAAGLSQTQVAARMGTSQSAVARLEAGEADVRASTLERYAAAIGSQISWRLEDTPPQVQLPPGGPERGPGLDPGPGQPSRPGHFGSPGLRPASAPLAPAAQHQPYGSRQEGSHDRTRG
jgi:DNA-binding transcriptional regulator YiaG